MSILQFTAHNHKYTSGDDTNWLSVTSLISNFKQPFDAEKIAAKVAKSKKSKWYGMTPTEIKEAWKSEANRATSLGTWYHNQREADICGLDNMERYGTTVPIFKPIEKEGIKYSPIQKIGNGVYPEHMVYLKSAGICGQSDLVEVINGVVHITDYKGLDLYTEIPTEIGFKLMKDIEVGDVIYDGVGNLTPVENVSEVHNNPCYKITFDTNDTIICDHEHKWFIDERISYGNPKGKNYNITYKEKEVTTLELINLFNNNKILRIKCVELNNTEKQLPIDPYVLGLWLGDGSKQCGAITNMVGSIWKEIENRGYSVGDDISKGGAGQATTKTILGIYPELKKLNLINNKFVPDIYLRASKNQRLDLLRGLMDSDGYFHKTRKRCVMNTTQKWQAEAIMELVSSLGYKPTLINSYTSFKNNKIKAYQVTFKMDSDCPFLIRNIDFKNTSFRINKYKKTEHRLIKNIELIDTVPTKCLSVKSETHSYLATRNYIKTHNTNKEIKLEGFTNWEGVSQKMASPLNHLDDCNLNHYAIQLSMYMFIILKHNPKLTAGTITIHHILFEEAGRDRFGNPISALDNDGNPIVTEVVQYDLPYLKKETIDIIHWLEDNKHNLKAKS